MASRQSENLRKTIRRLKPVFSSLPLEAQRRGQSALSRVNALPKGVRVEHDARSPLPAEWLINERAPEDFALLYLHGGAYCAGDLFSSRALACILCEKIGVNVFSFEYRLAPEHPYPAALEDAVAAYFYLLDEGYAPEKIGFIGDSAGGGLALCIALALRQKGNPLPGAVMCISPWADLARTGESNLVSEGDDPILRSDRLRENARMYCGGEGMENPLVSPVYGEYDEDFPPTLIHVGAKEILLEDSIRLERRMRAQGAPVSIEKYEGMWHVFHLFRVPESADAMQRISQFFKEALGVLSESNGD